MVPARRGVKPLRRPALRRRARALGPVDFAGCFAGSAARRRKRSKARHETAARALQVRSLQNRCQQPLARAAAKVLRDSWKGLSYRS